MIPKMGSTRLAPETGKLRPSEAVVQAVSGRLRAAGFLSRLHALCSPSGAHIHDRLATLDQDAARLVLHGLAVGAFGGSAERAATIPEAVKLHGEQMVHRACIGVLSLLLAMELGRPAGYAAKEHFRQAWVTASICAALAPSLGLDEEEAFACGLLHDVGCLAMASAFGEDYARIAGAAGLEASKLERKEFGIDHQAAGLALLISLQFSAVICEAAAFHHADPRRISVSARMVAAAESAARATGCCVPSRQAGAQESLAAAIAALGADESAEAALIKAAKKADSRVRLLVS